MKIDAIRLAEFRRFMQPAAIEGFDAGMNVFAGPNEMGKSTVFRALEAAFLTRHKVTGNVLNEMRPLAGGEPLVEVDFTVGERRWRIRKQFGRGSTAILSDAVSGAIVSRNADAEDQLAQLIGHDGGAGPLGLVWVRQKRALMEPDPDLDFETGRSRERGELTALQSAIRGEIEAAVAGEDVQRVQALAAKALDRLLTPTRNAPRKNGPLDQARREREQARLECERAERAAAAAEHRLQEIERAATMLARLRAPQEAARRRDDIARLEAALKEQNEKRRQREVLAETLKVQASQHVNARQALAMRRDRDERLEKLKAQSAAARALQDEVARLSEVINANPAARQNVERIAASIHARDLADVELKASAAIAEIALQPGGAGRILVNGVAIDADVRHEIDDTLHIAIPGIGDIRIVPPAAEKRAEARRRLDTASADIATLLKAAGVVSLDEAKARLTEREAAIKMLDRKRAELSGLAPRGIEALDAELGALATAAAEAPAIDALAEQLKSAEAAEHLARASFDSVAATLMAESAFRDLVAEHEKLRTLDANAVEDARRLEARIENLKSEQAGADEDGLAGEVATLRGRHARHDAEVKRLETEAKALLLLTKTLAEIEAQSSHKVFEPLSRRLRPYLVDVLGADELAFRDGFAVTALKRDGIEHAFANLSDGTQEQLSVLVRVAYADLLSEQGSAVPLVLDDPLVYSDEERFASIGRVLEKAALKHQVVLLTCRPGAFQNISGRRVSLTAWQPEK